MFKKFACAIAVVLVGSIALAETVRGIITEVKDDEITVNVRKKGEKKSEKKTFKIGKSVKVLKFKGKDDSEGSSLKDLKAAVKAASETKFKGAFATIEVDGDKATEIKFFSFGKKKPKKDD